MADRKDGLNEAQRRALIGVRDHGDPAHGLRGRSAFGGFSRTLRVLLRCGYLDDLYMLTDAGRRALAKDATEQTK